MADIMIATSPTRRCGCPSSMLLGRHRRTCAKYTAPKSPKKRRKPIVYRNQKRSPAAKASEQRAIAMERAGWRCEFEALLGSLTPDAEWRRCTATGETLETVHVIRRHMAGSAKYDPDVVIAGCRHHHDIYDGRIRPYFETTRMPEQFIERAVRCIRSHEAARKAAGKSVVPMKGPR